MSQQELATIVHCDRSYISRVESGKTTLPEGLLNRIAETLELSLPDTTSPEDDFLVQEIHRLTRLRRYSEAQTLAERTWWYALQENKYEVAFQVFDVWADLLPHGGVSSQAYTMFTTQAFLHARQQDNALFTIGVKFQNYLTARGDLTSAESISRAMLVLKPSPDALFRLRAGLGTILFRADKTEEAKFYYEGARQVWAPHLGETNLGRCYHGLGACAVTTNLARAQEHTRAACDIYRGRNEMLYYQAMQNQGIILAGIGQLSQAKRLLADVIAYLEARGDMKSTHEARTTLVELER